MKPLSQPWCQSFSDDTFFLARQDFTLRPFELQPANADLHDPSSLTDDVHCLKEELHKWEDKVKAFARCFKGKGLPVHDLELLYQSRLPSPSNQRFNHFFCAAVGDRVCTSG